VQAGIALYDEGRAAAAMIVYGTLEVLAFGARAAADLAEGMAQLAAQLAKGAARAAGLAARLADAAVHYAQYMASVAAQDWAIAGHYAALVAKLTAAYAKQMARKVAKAARAVGRVLKKVAKKLARAAVAVAKAAYKYSGAQDVVSCVTHPHLSSCLKAALTIALVVGTGGEGEAEVIAMDAAEQAGARAAEGAAEDTGGSWLSRLLAPKTTAYAAEARGDETFLYQKLSAEGSHLKYGITNNPVTRYTSEELNGGRLNILASGAKEDMLALERSLHETLPIGPEERQAFYIQKQVAKGLRPPPY